MSRIGHSLDLVIIKTSNSKTLQWVRLLCLMLALLIPVVCSAQTPGPDDQYLAIYSIIKDADSLDAGGQRDAAAAKYREAQTGLERLHKAYPNWSTKVVAFRMDYVAQKLAALPAKTATANTNTPAGEKQDKADTAGISSAQVKLLEPGAEPRKVLRLHPKPGDKQNLVMSIKMGMNMKMGEMESPAMKLPAMKMVMDLAVKSVSPEGDIAYDLAITDTSVDNDPDAQPMIVQALKTALGNVKGATGTGTVTDRGVPKENKINLPAGADPQTRQMIEQMSDSFSAMVMQLPEEGVGAGGKWEARLPIKSQGMKIDQTATYQLGKLDDEHLAVSVTVTQSAADQKIQNPAVPGVTVDLTRMSGRGSGEIKTDLSKVAPFERNGKYHSETSMAMGTGDQKQTLNMTMDFDIHIESK